MGPVSHPGSRPVAVWLGHPSGRWHHGRRRAAGGAGDPRSRVMNRYDAIVIGAGANGLATATLLARRNRRVLVLERRDVAGGTNATEEFHPGFRANACRDDAGWIPESLVRQLNLERHGLQWLPAMAGLVSISAESPPVAIYPDVRRTVDGLKALSPADAGQWTDFTAFVGNVAAFLQAAYS